MTLPLSHIFGLSSSMLTSLYAGATIHLVPRFDAGHLFKTLSKGDHCLSRGSNNVFQPVGIFGDKQTENRCSTSQVLIFRRGAYGH